MSNDERIRDFFDVEFPPTKENWPAFKDEHAKTKAILDEQEAAEDRQRRLDALESLANELRVLVRARNNPKQWQHIADCLRRMGEKVK